MQLSAAGLGVTSILQALGIIGTPFGMGQSPTETGTLATLIPVVTGVFGATGGFGALLNAGRMLLGGGVPLAPPASRNSLRAWREEGLWRTLSKLRRARYAINQLLRSRFGMAPRAWRGCNR